MFLVRSSAVLRLILPLWLMSSLLLLLFLRRTWLTLFSWWFAFVLCFSKLCLVFNFIFFYNHFKCWMQVWCNVNFLSWRIWSLAIIGIATVFYSLLVEIKCNLLLLQDYNFSQRSSMQDWPHLSAIIVAMLMKHAKTTQ